MPDEVVEKISTLWPQAYHVAHRDALDSILTRGLLSTARLLEVVAADDQTKERLVRRHRPESVEIPDSKFGRIVIRDQKPMDDNGLLRALPDRMNPADWYALLNQRVFFWLTRKRLSTFLNARAYRNKEHLVLTVDTAALVAAEYERVELSSMNSGATKPMPHPRDESIFAHVAEYPWEFMERRKARHEVAVELCVREGIPDIRPYIVAVHIMQGDMVLSTIDWRCVS